MPPVTLPKPCAGGGCLFRRSYFPINRTVYLFLITTFNCCQFIWHLPTPVICQTCSHTIQTMQDTLRHHPDTPIIGLHEATRRKSNIWIPWYLCNCFQFIWYLPNPDICQTCSDTSQKLLDTIQTPFKRPYFTVIWSYVISILLGPLVH